jgi:2-oxoglutarate dehydrogenase E1 component
LRPADKDVKRLVLCSGKVAYDLMEARDAAGDKNTAIVRVEQLYPFPGEPLVVRLKRMTNLEEVVWAQEEPQNNGSWFFVEPLYRGMPLPRPGKAPRARAMPGAAASARHRPDEASPGRAGRIGCRCAGSQRPR